MLGDGRQVADRFGHFCFEILPIGRVVLVCINILDQMLVVQHNILLIMLVSGATPGMLSKSPAYIR